MSQRSSSQWGLRRIAFGLLLAALAPAASHARGFELEHVLPEPASGPETAVALDAAGNFLLYGSRAEDEPGAAALYEGRSGELALTLTAPDPEVGISDAFGRSVALSLKRIVVSAPDREVVYVFDRTGELEQTLVNPGSENPAGSVATRGRFVVVGAPFASEDGSDAGAAYVFDARTGSLLHTLSGPGAGSRFGTAVAMLGSRIFVGAPGVIPNEGSPGRVIAFDARTGDELWDIDSPEPSSGDRFGAALAARGAALVVGAPFSDVDGNDSGAAFLVRGRDGTVIETYSNPSETADSFGWSVALSGAVVVVGAPQADSIETDAGAAHLFRRGGRLVKTLDPVPTTFCGGAGKSVAAGRGFVAVGVQDCFGDSATYVYTR